MRQYIILLIVNLYAGCVTPVRKAVKSSLASRLIIDTHRLEMLVKSKGYPHNYSLDCVLLLLKLIELVNWHYTQSVLTLFWTSRSSTWISNEIYFFAETEHWTSKCGQWTWHDFPKEHPAKSIDWSSGIII